MKSDQSNSPTAKTVNMSYCCILCEKWQADENVRFRQSAGVWERMQARHTKSIVDIHEL
jgi:hypothetical protein